LSNSFTFLTSTLLITARFLLSVGKDTFIDDDNNEKSNSKIIEYARQARLVKLFLIIFY
jgi:hypothetical protein